MEDKEFVMEPFNLIEESWKKEEDESEERCWTVYVHIVPKEMRSSPDRDDYYDKYYVGITSQPVNKRWRNGNGYSKQRFGRAIKKYGWENIIHEIVANNLNIDEASKFEHELVQKLDSNSRHGYNSDQGGVIYGTNWDFKEDLTGQVFERLIVLGNDPNDSSKVICQCSCENKTIKSINRYSLLKGGTRSCGCLQKEVFQSAVTKHGMKHEKIYTTWQKMKASCYMKTDENFHNVGAKGICVCDEWNNDFLSFYNWAINNGYEESNKCVIDRIDKSKDFTPDNSIWVTKHEKLSRKSNAHIITYNGKTQCVGDWEKEFGVKRGFFANRINKGMSVEEAFDLNIDRAALLNSHATKYEYNGEYHTIREWSEILSIDLKKLRSKIYNGKTIEQAINMIKKEGVYNG